MRDHILSETSNIKAAHQAMNYLIQRPIAHQPGLGMIYGAPGLGKTQFSQRTCIRNDYVYFSAKKADTAKSFIASLVYLLRLRYYPREFPSTQGSASKLFNQTLDILNANTSQTHLPVIFIDEVDNIIHNPHEEIVGMLRDIVDNSAAIVMLIGMQDLRNKIVKLNAHYYNRVVYFCEFSPLGIADVRLMVRDLCEVYLADDLIKHIAESASGDARKVIKFMRLYEELALANSLDSLDSAKVKKLTSKPKETS
ncbi:MAG TPA: AAA family ATPase [Candidatus Cloacimonadota bacterium]|nr:AAA family ATPase [Candidatus Cloacimonadota bacterium]